MRPIALVGIYIASAGLVTLAVEAYDYDPGLLIVWAAAGLGALVIGLFVRGNGKDS